MYKVTTEYVSLLQPYTPSFTYLQSQGSSDEDTLIQAFLMAYEDGVSLLKGDIS
jgi:hypothetical protein